MQQIDKKHPLVDGIFLLKLATPSQPSLIAMSEGNCNIIEDIQALEFCTPTSEIKIYEDCTFVFNNGDVFYYTLYFHHKQETYELIIKSYQRCVSFFLNFLNQLFMIFSDVKIAYDPDNFFNLAKILTSDWPTDLNDNMKIVFPYSMHSIEFTTPDFTYHHFKRSIYFDTKLHLKIFSYLFAMKPILVVAPDASIGCRACFSILSFMHPLRYVEPFIFWLRKGDQRYDEIKKGEGKSPYLVVVTDAADEIQSKFDLVVSVTEISKNDSKFDSDFENFVKKILLAIQDQLVSLITKNPYSDILNLPFTDKNMEEIMKDPKFKFMPSLNILKIFEKSKTSKNWRFRRCNKETMRNAILQCGEVNFEELSKDQLEIIIKYIKSVKKDFENDMHVSAVIKKHSSIISSILAKENSK